MGAWHARSLPRDPGLRARAEGDPISKPVSDERPAHLIREATRAFVRALQVRLARHEVPFGHWTFLRILWQQDGLTQRELSDEAGVMEPTTFAAIRAMERLGYVSRRQIADNRKNVYIHLTSKGRALEAKLVPLAEDVNAIALRGIHVEDVAAMRRVLVAILENLDDDARGRASTRRLPKPRNATGARRASSSRVARTSARRRRAHLVEKFRPRS